MHRTLFALPFYASVLFASVNATLSKCYFPNGDLAGSDVPCNPLAENSHCCFKGQACLSNGLCQINVGAAVPEYARPTCTDKNWGSPECPNFCMDVKTGSGNPVYSCNVTGSAEYCCNDGCSCSDPAKIVSFAALPSTVTVIGASASASATSAKSSSTTLKNSASSSSSKSTATGCSIKTVTVTKYSSSSTKSANSSTSKTSSGKQTTSTHIVTQTPGVNTTHSPTTPAATGPTFTPITAPNLATHSAGLSQAVWAAMSLMMLGGAYIAYIPL